jgi:Ca2+-binding EF-hand superfamily protein
VDSPTKEEVNDILDEIDENGDNKIDKYFIIYILGENSLS